MTSDLSVSIVPKSAGRSLLLALVKDQRDSLVALVFRLASAAMLFGLVVTLARILGPEQFGIYAFVFALMQMSVSIGRGGLPNMLVRELALSSAEDDRDARRRHLQLGWMVAVPLSALIASIFMCGLLPMLTSGMALPPSVAAFGALYIAAMILVGMIEATLRGSGRILIGQVAEFLVRPGLHLLIIICATAWVSARELDLSWVLGAATVAAGSALAFCLFVYVRVFEMHSFSERLEKPPAFLRSFFTLSGTVWVAALNAHVNLVLLGILGANAELGVYQVAVQLTTLMALGLMAVNASVAPEMSRLMAGAGQGNKDRLQRLASRSCEISLAFGVPLCAVYVLFGSQLIPFIFSAQFSGAYEPTIILAFGQVVNIVFGSIATLLNSSHQEHVVLRAIILATIANVLLCFTLIPAFGAIGAAIASVVSLIIWNGMSFVRLLATRGVISLPFVSCWRRICGTKAP